MLRLPALTLALGLALLLAQPRAVRAEGLSFDECDDSRPCAGTRLCKANKGAIPCPAGATDGCLCYPNPEPKECAGSFDCELGERCVREGNNTPFCASCRSFFRALPGVEPVDRNAESCLMPGRDFLGGFTGDACGVSGTAACVPPRACLSQVDDSEKFEPCTRRDNNCECRDGPIKPCSTSTDCAYGERCITLKDRKGCLSCRRIELSPLLNASDPGDTVRCLTPASASSPSPPPPTSDRAPYKGGFSWDPCTVDPAKADETLSLTCPEEHNCSSSRDPKKPLPCRAQDPNCFCRPAAVERYCLVSTHCLAGERCVRLFNETNVNRQFCAGCVGAQINDRVGDWVLVDPDSNCVTRAGQAPSPSPTNTPPPVLVPTIDPSSYPRGLTLDFCAGRDRAICRGARKCRAGDRESACSPDDRECFCWPEATVACTDSSPCSGGERCASGGQGNAFCTSCTVVRTGLGEDGDANCGKKPDDPPAPSPTVALSAAPSAVATPSAASSGAVSTASTGATAASPTPLGGSGGSSSPGTSENVCVGAHHLTGLSAPALVFGSRHRTANVLCDAGGSCATRGHIVVFHGAAMRMGAYCAQAGVMCRQERMLVNSPRWRRGLRVASRTEGLEFTALAARWETVAEEHVLRAMVRLGA